MRALTIVVSIVLALASAAGAQPGGNRPNPNQPNPNQPGGPIRPGFGPGIFPMPELKKGQVALFFLAKHPTADFYVIAGGAAPIDLKTDAGKKQLEAARKALARVTPASRGCCGPTLVSQADSTARSHSASGSR